MRFDILRNAEAGTDGAEEEVKEEFEEEDRVGKERGMITRQVSPSGSGDVGGAAPRER